MHEDRKYDYGVWWSDEDHCFIARALTLQASTGYGDSPEEALRESITLAEMNAENGDVPVAAPLSEPGSADWTPGAILELRRSLSLTQVEFAAFLNVSPRAVSHWEQGLRPTSGASSRLLDLVAASPGIVHRWIVAREAKAA